MFINYLNLDDTVNSKHARPESATPDDSFNPHTVKLPQPQQYNRSKRSFSDAKEVAGEIDRFIPNFYFGYI